MGAKLTELRSAVVGLGEVPLIRIDCRRKLTCCQMRHVLFNVVIMDGAAFEHLLLSSS